MKTFETSKGKFAFIDKPMIGVTVIDNAQEITKEQWECIVDEEVEIAEYWYSDYTRVRKPIRKLTALEVGKSLMESLGINDNSWLLVKL